MNFQALKGGIVYFLLVFAAGFFLGIFRVLVLVPRLGAGTSELIELPVMVLISIVAARFVVRQFEIDGLTQGLMVGLLALGLLIFAELTLVLGIQGLTIREYVDSREPVSFVAYLVSLLIFGAMPAVLSRRKG